MTWGWTSAAFPLQWTHPLTFTCMFSCDSGEGPNDIWSYLSLTKRWLLSFQVDDVFQRQKPKDVIFYPSARLWIFWNTQLSDQWILRKHGNKLKGGEPPPSCPPPKRNTLFTFFSSQSVGTPCCFTTMQWPSSNEVIRLIILLSNNKAPFFWSRVLTNLCGNLSAGRDM